MNLLDWMKHEKARRQMPDAVAKPELIGRFIWCEYWRHWAEILDCMVDPRAGFGNTSWWSVRTVGTDVVRNHCTRFKADCIFDKPLIDADGRHLNPFIANFAASTKPVAAA